MNIGGKNRNGVAAFDTLTGNLTDWNPDVMGTVTAMDLLGSTLYIVGVFGAIGDLQQHDAGAIDILTGNATAWCPEIRGYLNDVAASESAVYLVGTLWYPAEGNRETILENVIATDPMTGALSSWNPNPKDEVHTLALSDDGQSVYVNGDFLDIGGKTRSGLAQFDFPGVSAGVEDWLQY